MIDTLKKDLAAAEAASRRIGDSVDFADEDQVYKYLYDKRYYDGYITALKHVILVIKENNRDKALNPFLKGVE